MKTRMNANRPDRRRAMIALGVGTGLAATGGLRAVHAQPATSTGPLNGELAAAVAAYTGGPMPRPGKVLLDVAQLVDNGNTVPMTVRVESAMTAADRVVAVAVFNERNPQREIAVFRFGPGAGKAVVDTRIRLATSQTLVAVATFADGSHWSHAIDVVVTLAACIEGEAS